MTALAAAMIILLTLFAGCGGDHEESYPGEFDITYSLGDRFTINALGVADEYRRYKWVVIDVVLEVGDESIIATFESRNHRLREIVTDAIKARSLDQLNVVEEKVVLRQEIMDKINGEFNTSAVNRVVFAEFYFA
jgi:flagellar basal body-associated protein FliL